MDNLLAGRRQLLTFSLTLMTSAIFCLRRYGSLFSRSLRSW